MSGLEMAEGKKNKNKYKKGNTCTVRESNSVPTIYPEVGIVDADRYTNSASLLAEIDERKPAFL